MTGEFIIPLWADLLAIGIGALQGALFAAQFRDRRLDLLGVAIIGIATGFGGGIIRDLLLSEVPAALRATGTVLVAIGAALLGMLLEAVFRRVGWLITALDALTIGLFGAIGTTKALAVGLPPVPAVFVGAVSAVGGSILRDLLLNLPIALMHVGSLYAVAAIAGMLEPGHHDRARRAGAHRRHRLRGDHLRRAGAGRAVQVVAAGAAAVAPSPHLSLHGTAPPDTSKDLRWRGHERESLEVLRYTDDLARSEVRFGNEAWRYEVELEDWVTRRVTVGPLVLEHDDDGWRVDGEPRPDLADAVDIDIVLTPFTNTLPIRRHDWEIGQSRDFTMAWVDVPSLEVIPDPQRYTRIDNRVYRFESLDSDFTRDIQVDADGFVVEYPGLFSRV